MRMRTAAGPDDERLHEENLDEENLDEENPDEDHENDEDATLIRVPQRDGALEDDDSPVDDDGTSEVGAARH